MEIRRHLAAGAKVKNVAEKRTKDTQKKTARHVTLCVCVCALVQQIQLSLSRVCSFLCSLLAGLVLVGRLVGWLVVRRNNITLISVFFSNTPSHVEQRSGRDYHRRHQGKHVCDPLICVLPHRVHRNDTYIFAICRIAPHRNKVYRTRDVQCGSTAFRIQMQITSKR